MQTLSSPTPTMPRCEIQSFWQPAMPGSSILKAKAGQLELAITDQTDRGCGWVWHVEVECIYEHGTIEQRGGFADADEAKRACIEWVRAFCAETLSALEGAA